MLTVPRSKVVRGFSFFGVSFVYVIFEDGTDIYWARSRVLEYLNAAGKASACRRHADLGPGRHRRRLGLPVRRRRQEQVPRRAALAAGLGDPLRAVQGRGRRRGGQRRRLRQAIQRRRRPRPHALARHPAVKRCARSSATATWTSAAARSSSPSTSSWCAAAAISKASATSRRIVVKVDGGTPVLLKDIARVELGPDERRGIAELNGEGEVASGIALQRFGANALNVIDNVKAAPRRRLPRRCPRAPRSSRSTTAPS